MYGWKYKWAQRSIRIQIGFVAMSMLSILLATGCHHDNSLTSTIPPTSSSSSASSSTSTATQPTATATTIPPSSLTTTPSTGSSTGTSISQTTDKPVDIRLVGEWTTQKELQCVSLLSTGQPTGPVPVGEWYAFKPDGSYFRVTRFMTFAIGGIGVEEGRYRCQPSGSVAGESTLTLYNRTDSFYPDEGSPQKPSYREPVADQVWLYSIVSVAGSPALQLRLNQDETAVQYRQAQCDP